jgi:uncharacterized protein (TIRG00374 family)
VRPARFNHALIVALVVVLVAGAVIAATYRLRGFDWERFAATFRSLNVNWLAAAVGLSYSAYVGRALRWKALIKPQKPDACFWRLLDATVIGFSAMVLFGRPGEMVRPYLIAKKEGLSFSSQVAAWLLERIYDLLMVLLIFGFALTKARGARDQVGPTLQWVFATGGFLVGGLSALSLGLLVVLGRFSETAERRIHDALEFLPDPMRARMRGLLNSFVHGVASTKSRLVIAEIVGLSAVEWLAFVGIAYCLMQAVPALSAFEFTDAAIFLGFVSFGAIVQVPGIGGGVQVASAVVLTQLFGLTLEEASGFALLFWLVSFVSIVPVGLALAFREGLRFSALREMGAKATSD